MILTQTSIKVINRSLILALCLLSFSAFAQSYDFAEFLVLNKVTTEKEEFQLKRSEKYSVSGIEIELFACQKNSKESFDQALISVSKTDSDTKDVVFSGWTFSHSPAISMLEHPIYNLILLNCLHSE